MLKMKFYKNGIKNDFLIFSEFKEIRLNKYNRKESYIKKCQILNLNLLK